MISISTSNIISCVSLLALYFLMDCLNQSISKPFSFSISFFVTSSSYFVQFLHVSFISLLMLSELMSQSPY